MSNTSIVKPLWKNVSRLFKNSHSGFTLYTSLNNSVAVATVIPLFTKPKKCFVILSTQFTCQHSRQSQSGYSWAVDDKPYRTSGQAYCHQSQQIPTSLTHQHTVPDWTDKCANTGKMLLVIRGEHNFKKKLIIPIYINIVNYKLFRGQTKFVLKNKIKM